MTKEISNQIAIWSLGKDYTYDSDEFQIISYGIELILETIYKLIVLLVLGGMCGILPETIAFLIGFSGLRANAGGLHMKTSLGCMFAVISCWLLSLLGMYVHIGSPLYIGLFALTFVIVAHRAPVSTSNNPIKDYRIRKQKKVKATIYVVVITVIAHIFVPEVLTKVLIIAMAIEALTLIPKEKGGEMYGA